MFIAGCGVVWITLVALDVWTGHGKYEVVPNMRGLTYNQASAALAAAGLNVELSDSIYDEHTQPGTVLVRPPRHSPILPTCLCGRRVQCSKV